MPVVGPTVAAAAVRGSASAMARDNAEIRRARSGPRSPSVPGSGWQWGDRRQPRGECGPEAAVALLEPGRGSRCRTRRERSPVGCGRGPPPPAWCGRPRPRRARSAMRRARPPGRRPGRRQLADGHHTGGSHLHGGSVLARQDQLDEVQPARGVVLGRVLRRPQRQARGARWAHPAPAWRAVGGRTWRWSLRAGAEHRRRPLRRRPWEPDSGPARPAASVAPMSELPSRCLTDPFAPFRTAPPAPTWRPPSARVSPRRRWRSRPTERRWTWRRRCPTGPRCAS